MKKHLLVASILLHAAFLIIVYIFQGVVFPFMRINGLVPLLLPVATIGIALYEGRDIGGIFGLFAGILCDISFNQPVGVFTVLLTISGLVVGTLADIVILRGFVTFYISSTAILIVSAIVQLFPIMLIPESAPPFTDLMAIVIQQTIYSLVFALPIWFFVRALGKRADKVSSSGHVY